MAISKRVALHPHSGKLFLTIVGIALLTPSSSVFSASFARRRRLDGLLRRSGSEDPSPPASVLAQRLQLRYEEEEAFKYNLALLKFCRDYGCIARMVTDALIPVGTPIHGIIAEESRGHVDPTKSCKIWHECPRRNRKGATAGKIEKPGTANYGQAGTVFKAIAREPVVVKTRIKTVLAVYSFQFDPRLCKLLQNFRDVSRVTVTKTGPWGAAVRTQEGLVGIIPSRRLGNYQCTPGSTAAVIISHVRPRFFQVANPRMSHHYPIVFEAVDPRMVSKPEHDAALDKLHERVEAGDSTCQVEVTMVRGEIIYILAKSGLPGWIPLHSLGLHGGLPRVGDELNVTVAGIRQDGEWTFLPPRAQGLISSFTREDPMLFGRLSLLCAGPQLQELLTNLRGGNVVLAKIAEIQTSGVRVEIAGAEFWIPKVDVASNIRFNPHTVFSLGDQVKVLCTDATGPRISLKLLKRLKRRALRRKSRTR
ncbi:RPS1 [Symbiodinium sp. CCMP2592]|nr:RPS1 [Symbiodinium sp. CCMP2592]